MKKERNRKEPLVPLAFLPIIENGAIRLVKSNDVICIKISDSVIKIRFDGQELGLLKKFRSLDGLLTRLNQKTFFRVNRNLIVNVSKIHKVVRYTGKKYELYLQDGSKIEISKISTLFQFFGWVK